MTVHRINPLLDGRWADYISNHPQSSIFHTVEWLEALKSTYGYEPLLYTTSEPDQQLTNGVLFCSVQSWISGCRLVGLPFSDHCEPLTSQGSDAGSILSHVVTEHESGRWKYIELRPLTSAWGDLYPLRTSSHYWLHKIDLTQPLDSLFLNLHKDCIARKLERQEREGLRIEEGVSQPLLDSFYTLFLLTRRRHKIPPTPRVWFDNLIKHLGHAITVRVCFKERMPIASMITIRHRDVLTYKYGCSDTRFHNLGPMPTLFWNAITKAKNDGLRELDLGRTDITNQGLARFKARLGSVATMLMYLRYPEPSTQSWVSGVPMVADLFARLPDPLFAMSGRLLYKHAA